MNMGLKEMGLKYGIEVSPCPETKDQSAKFLQSEDIFVKQLVAVFRVCVCADAAKNDYLTLRNHCWTPLFGQLGLCAGPRSLSTPQCGNIQDFAQFVQWHKHCVTIWREPRRRRTEKRRTEKKYFAESLCAAGGIGFLHCGFFLLGTCQVIRWFWWLCPSVASMDGQLKTKHTSCLINTFQVVSDTPIPRSGCGVSCQLFLFCFWFAVFVFCVSFSVLFASGEWHHTASHHDYRKLATVAASLALISTASKHLHDDLAKAIEALEQKNCGIIVCRECGGTWPYLRNCGG